jgi:hypothetical protein
MPVEKHKDDKLRLSILHKAAPYCLSKESLDTILEANGEKLMASVDWRKNRNKPLMCPFAEHYDGDIHDALANLCRVDGSIPSHDKYGPPVNFSLQKRTASTGYELRLGSLS